MHYPWPKAPRPPTHRSFTDREKVRHTKILEAMTANMASDWALRSKARRYRVVMLIDSAVVLSSFMKGHSSRKWIMSQIQRFAAIKISHGVRIQLLHISSKLNPTDHTSRTRNHRATNRRARTPLWQGATK